MVVSIGALLDVGPGTKDGSGSLAPQLHTAAGGGENEDEELVSRFHDALEALSLAKEDKIMEGVGNTPHHATAACVSTQALHAPPCVITHRSSATSLTRTVVASPPSLPAQVGLAMGLQRALFRLAVSLLDKREIKVGACHPTTHGLLARRQVLTDHRLVINRSPSMLQGVKHFRYAVIHNNVGSTEDRLFTHPLALTKLAIFLVDVDRELGKAPSRARCGGPGERPSYRCPRADREGREEGEGLMVAHGRVVLDGWMVCGVGQDVEGPSPGAAGREGQHLPR